MVSPVRVRVSPSPEGPAKRGLLDFWSELVGALTHVTDDERYGWLNSVVCAVAGVLEPHPDGPGFDVILDVAQLIWERPPV